MKNIAYNMTNLMNTPFIFEVIWKKPPTSFGDMNKQTEKMTKSLMDFFTRLL